LGGKGFAEIRFCFWKERGILFLGGNGIFLWGEMVKFLERLFGFFGGSEILARFGFDWRSLNNF
jgi:hypothetical protein